MPLVGIIAKKRDIQAIKKELAEYEVEIIHLNKEALKNMKNIIFKDLIILEDINLQEAEYSYMEEIISKAEYLILNSDIDFGVLKYIKLKKPIKTITFGFNPKSTITISSVKEDKILVCLQRNIENGDKEIIETQEKEIEITKDSNKQIYNKLVVFILKELHNL